MLISAAVWNWKLVWLQDVQDKAADLHGKLGLGTGGEGTNKAGWKARFFVRGRKDSMEKSLFQRVSALDEIRKKASYWNRDKISI